VQWLSDIASNPTLGGGSAMPKSGFAHKWRSTMPPTSLGCRTPPPQKLRQQKTKLLPKIVLQDKAHSTDTTEKLSHSQAFTTQ